MRRDIADLHNIKVVFNMGIWKACKFVSKVTPATLAMLVDMEYLGLTGTMDSTALLDIQEKRFSKERLIPGLPGTDGTNGAQEDQGLPGYDGIIGQQGYMGMPTVNDGQRRKLGDSRPVGIHGKPGGQGSLGPDGVNGPPGPNGPPGYPGALGSVGSHGDGGPQGDQGLTGDPGYRGMPRYKGGRGRVQTNPNISAEHRTEPEIRVPLFPNRSWYPIIRVR